MTLNSFKEKLSKEAVDMEFNETMSIIDKLYTFTPGEFSNGDIVNAENQNNGSCKLFAFAKKQGFTKEETLMCFGKFYTQEVLNNPEGDDHQNIRNFMKHGWDGIAFKNEVLQQK